MPHGHLHLDVHTAQSAKRPGQPCGDVVRTDRSPRATTVICCDGYKSGIRARIAAQLWASRLGELLKRGFSLRDAFARVAETIDRTKADGHTYAALSMARVQHDGQASVLSYEAPPAVLISRKHATPLAGRQIAVGGGLIDEANCYLEPDEGLILRTDGISQAGLGSGRAGGWDDADFCATVDQLLAGGLKPHEVVERLHRRALELWGSRRGDDCTAVLAWCRQGVVVTLLTGPPANRDADAEVVHRFCRATGLKAVCGATTAQLVARHTHAELRVHEPAGQMHLAPPTYEIDGCDLVTEGAVTLNQVVNLLDDPDGAGRDGAGQLLSLLQAADRVNVYLGTAENPGSADVAFRQQGIAPRRQIVPRLAEKLRQAGKLVVVEEV